MPRIIECLGDLNDGTPFPTSPFPSVPMTRDLARRVLEDAETKIIRSQEAIGKKVVQAASQSASNTVNANFASFKTLAWLAALGGGIYYAKKKGWI